MKISEARGLPGNLGSRLRTLALRLGFAVWAAAMLLIGSVLMAGHWLALPLPAAVDPILKRALAQLDDGAQGQWQLVHVMYSECRCSQRTLDYLSSRATPDGVKERILLVGKDATRASQARSHGFLVEEITAEELKLRFNIESAPLLIAIDPSGALRYVGGYTQHQQGLDYQDLEILADLRANRPNPTLPAYGCAVSKELQSYLDPIGIKYRR